MADLSNPQIALLKAAAAAPDRGVNQPDGASATVKSLIRRGLIIAMPRENAPTRLLITTAGHSAVSLGDDAVLQTHDIQTGSDLASLDNVVAELPSRAPGSAATNEPKGKIGAVVKLLRRPGGATLEAMMQVTGWQAHSVRGAMSGSIKKGLGLDVLSVKTEAGRVYRIPTAAFA